MTETNFRENARFWATSLLRRNRNETPFPCPIAGYPCKGDLSHLCKEYGCARKSGLSLRADENS